MSLPSLLTNNLLTYLPLTFTVVEKEPREVVKWSGDPEPLLCRVCHHRSMVPLGTAPPLYPSVSAVPGPP